MIRGMERTSAEPENLDELPLDRIRDLDLEAVGDGSPPYVASASGVARRGRHVYVIGDESNHLACFDFTDRRPGGLKRVLDGEVPTDPAERARHKSDLEALTVLPPGRGSPYGILLGVGSGSGGGRNRGFAWDLEADGDLVAEPREIDLSPAYALLREELGGLNIEGAAVLGDGLLLFHRGNAEGDENAVARFPLARALESLRGDQRIDVDELESLRRYDLGELEGIRLCFSDATPLGDELVVFTASAEDDDGTIQGSVIGLLHADGDIRRLRKIDRRWKVEGVHATMDTGVVDLLFVCDQDDPETPSPLLAASMPVEPGLE